MPSDMVHVDFEVLRQLQELGYNAEMKLIDPRKLETVIIVNGKEFSVRYWGTKEDVDKELLNIINNVAVIGGLK